MNGRLHTMKKVYRIFLPFLLCCLVLPLAACKASLPAPSGVNIDPITLSLSWNPVSGADYYTIRVEGTGDTREIDSSQNSYSLESLEAGSYMLHVKAVAGMNNALTDSAWSESLTFVREAETGLTFRLIDSNTAFEVSGLGTASNDVTVPDTYRGLPVVAIGERAFYNKNTLTSVSLGKNIETIRAQAFENCVQLNSVSLPQGLTSIGERAFQSCRALDDDIVFPDGVTEIGAQAFGYCRALRSVQFGKNLKTIGESAFHGCSSLTSVLIPDSVTSLGDGAFADCSGIVSAKIGSGIGAIGTDTFRSCDKLTSVQFGGAEESIGDFAFAECPALQTVSLPESVRTIGKQAFYGDTALTEAKIGANIEKISSAAFAETGIMKKTGATYLGDWFLGTSEGSEPAFRDGTVGIADYALQGWENLPGILSLPDSVKYIGEGAFKDSASLADVILGSGVEQIGDYAFDGCTGLTQIILGARDDTQEGRLGESSLTSIGSYAFRKCSFLTEITMPETLGHIGTYAFRDSGIWENGERVVYAGNWLVDFKPNDIIGSVSVQDGTRGIADYAFYQSTELTGISIPESVQYIGRSAFYQCTSLAEVTLPDGLTEIEDYTFYHCDSLVLPNLPSSLKRIGRSAFYKCALATQMNPNQVLNIPASVTEIGAYAFYDTGFEYEDPNGTEQDGSLVAYGGIVEVNIGSGVKQIGERAFAKTESIKKVTMGDAVEQVGERAFYQCTSLADVTFGSNVKEIGDRAFYSCTSLTSAEMPASVARIGNYAFYKCSALARVRFGNTESIGDYAFFGCTSLRSLQLPSSLLSLGNQAFRGCSGLESVTLPGSVSEIGAHAFYGCSALTIYAGAAQAGADWNTRWNSAYRPAVWGCSFGEDGYLVSFTKTDAGVTGITAATPLTPPRREGYSFAGWARTLGGAAEYAADELDKVPDGTILYAVWVLE